MALLTEDIRKKYFKELGLGAYNKTNIKKLQAKYMERKSDADGIYGQNTDNLLRHLYNCHKYLNKDNFKPEEFKCECNGRYCCGYPTYMKPAQLTNLQTIRNKYKKPMVITSGMRCKGYNNAIGGSISNSKHLLGQATDFYMQGVTDTLANRKNFIKYSKNLPNTTYIYGNGINIYGNPISAPYMGNAIHYDTSNGNPAPAPKPTPDGKLVVDGIGGASTVKRMQEFFDTSVDGVISGQNLNLKKYYPSLTSVKGGSGGSPCIKKLQLWVGTTQDGVLGQGTVKAWQKKIGVTADGIFGKASMKAWQKYLNSHSKPVYPPAPKPRKKWKVIDISEFQDTINWTKAKADGVQGAIVRCGLRGAGTGTLKQDSMFLNHIKGAYKVGIPVGIYMFTEAINAKEGKEEADYAIKLWQKANLPISFPIAVDTENVFYKENGKKIAGRANDTKLSRAKRTEAIKAFCERVKEKGYTPMIYASTSWLYNQLDMSKLPYDVWVAQYNSTCEYEGKYVIWQYTSEGRVAGAKGDIDLNHCYIAPKAVNPPKPAPTPTPTEKKTYQGTFPSLRLKKSNAKVIADAITWAKKVAENNSFHYGYGKHSHHNGCYYCGTQHLKKGHGIKRYETTYCCNPFVGAAWAHGGCVPEALKLCEDCDSWDFGTDKGSYEKSKLFDKVSLKSLKKGDVLCSDRHVALYIGNGKVVQAGHEDDNVEHSKSWNDSIAVGTWDGYKRAYRFNGKVDAEMPLKFGEYSDRVADLQRYLMWYGYKISETSFFNSATLDAVKDFQREQKLVADGIVGEKTIEAMKKVKK